MDGKRILSRANYPNSRNPMEMGCSLNFRINMICSGINVKKKVSKSDIWVPTVYGKCDDRLFLVFLCIRRWKIYRYFYN